MSSVVDRDFREGQDQRRVNCLPIMYRRPASRRGDHLTEVVEQSAVGWVFEHVLDLGRPVSINGSKERDGVVCASTRRALTKLQEVEVTDHRLAGTFPPAKRTRGRQTQMIQDIDRQLLRTIL